MIAEMMQLQVAIMFPRLDIVDRSIFISLIAKFKLLSRVPSLTYIMLAHMLVQHVHGQIYMCYQYAKVCESMCLLIVYVGVMSAWPSDGYSMIMTRGEVKGRGNTLGISL